jgi:hypothetical protein
MQGNKVAHLRELVDHQILHFLQEHLEKSSQSLHNQWEDEVDPLVNINILQPTLLHVSHTLLLPGGCLAEKANKNADFIDGSPKQ